MTHQCFNVYRLHHLLGPGLEELPYRVNRELVPPLLLLPETECPQHVLEEPLHSCGPQSERLDWLTLERPSALPSGLPLVAGERGVVRDLLTMIFPELSVLLQSFVGFGCYESDVLFWFATVDCHFCGYHLIISHDRFNIAPVQKIPCADPHSTARHHQYHCLKPDVAVGNHEPHFLDGRCPVQSIP